MVKPKYCFTTKRGQKVCAPVKKGKKRVATSKGAAKAGNFQRDKITKGYSSGKIIRKAAANVSKQRRPQTQAAIKRLMRLRRRRDANRRYVARKKAGTVRKAGTRTGAKYRKKK